MRVVDGSDSLPKVVVCLQHWKLLRLHACFSVKGALVQIGINAGQGQACGCHCDN